MLRSSTFGAAKMYMYRDGGLGVAFVTGLWAPTGMPKKLIFHRNPNSCHGSNRATPTKGQGGIVSLERGRATLSMIYDPSLCRSIGTLVKHRERLLQTRNPMFAIC